MTNYTSDREKFKNWIRIYPLYEEGRVSHFLGVLERITDRYGANRVPNATASAAVAVSTAPAAKGGMSGTSSSGVHIHSPVFYSPEYSDSMIGVMEGHSLPPPLTIPSLAAGMAVDAVASGIRWNQSESTTRTNSTTGGTRTSQPKKSTPRASRAKSSSSTGRTSTTGSTMSTSTSQGENMAAGSESGAGGEGKGHPVDPALGYSYPLTYSLMGDVQKKDAGDKAREPHGSSSCSGSSSYGSRSDSGGTSRDSSNNFDDGSLMKNNVNNHNANGGPGKQNYKHGREGQDLESYRLGSGLEPISGAGDSSQQLFLRNISSNSMSSIVLMPGDIGLVDDNFAFDDDLLSYPLNE